MRIGIGIAVVVAIGLIWSVAVMFPRGQTGNKVGHPLIQPPRGYGNRFAWQIVRDLLGGGARHHPAAFSLFSEVLSAALIGRAAVMTTTDKDFAYRIDRWDTQGRNIVQHVANVDDLVLAMAAYEAARKHWPGETVTLREGARVIRDSRQ
jgi:hypothetical protein